MDANRERLGDLVRQQRQRLGLSVRAAARKADVDRATWTGLEDGTRATQDRHYAGIEQALEWALGSIEAILAGGTETPLAQHQRTEPELRDDAEREIWSMTLVPEDLRWTYIQQYREQRKGRAAG